MLRRPLLLALVTGIALFHLNAQPAHAAPIEHGAFARTWERTDRPVSEGQLARTWMWGPAAATPMLTEPYDQAPGGQRIVQYFDKSRMEITNPAGNATSIWYVTNGLLVTELVTGRLQTGDSSTEQHASAQINVAGDPDDATAPTYASFSGLLGAPAAPEGEYLQTELLRDGSTLHNAAFGVYEVQAAHHVAETGHMIAGPFWEFMNASGTVYEDGAYLTAALFPNPYYATGYPITEAYWANVRIAGTLRSVLIQCFERRCLTYTPENPPEWQVEAGNVGQHYYTWRYTQLGKVPSDAPTPTTGDVRIVDVVYDPPGNEGQEESVTIVNRSETAVQLQGWRIEDASGTLYYTFPSFEIPAQASVTIHACAGVNTPTLLFNGRCSPTWNNDGDTGILIDATGQVVHSYWYTA